MGPVDTVNGARKSGLANAMIETAASSVVFTIVTFATGMVLARALGPEARGVFSSVQFLAQFCLSFLSFSLFEALVMRVRQKRSEAAQAVPFAFLMSGGLWVISAAVVVVVFVFDILSFEGMADGFLLPFILILVGINLADATFGSIESADLSFHRLNIDRLVSPTAYLVVVNAFWIADRLSVETALIIFAVAKMPVMVWRLIRYRRHLVGVVDVDFARSVFSIAPKLHLATGVYGLALQFDRLIIVGRWPADWLGFYFVAHSVAGVGVVVITQAISMTLLPSLAGRPIEEQRAMLERLIRLSLAVAVFLGAFLWVAAPFIVPLVYGGDFSTASTFVRGILFAILLTPTLQILYSANRALGAAWPCIEMAIALLIVLLAGFVLTGFERPGDLFGFMFVANIVAVMSGFRHLARAGGVRPVYTLMVQPSDLRFLAEKIIVRLRRRVDGA
ncbi:MAG: oligosaccharide flippase family protein [Pseudomonadota bacterium]